MTADDGVPIFAEALGIAASVICAALAGWSLAYRHWFNAAYGVGLAALFWWAVVR